MTAYHKKLLIHAAGLLDAEAKAAYDSCKGSVGPWACGDCGTTCNAQRRYVDLTETAKNLRKMLGRAS